MYDFKRGGGGFLLGDRGKSLPAVDSIVLFWATNTARFVDCIQDGDKV